MKSYTIFYKNNFIRTRLKFAPKLRTSQEQLRLGFGCLCNCKFLLKNTKRCCKIGTRISCAKLSFSALNLLLAAVKILFGFNINMFATITDMMETRTIQEQLRLKLCENLRKTRFGQNLLRGIQKGLTFFRV